MLTTKSTMANKSKYSKKSSQKKKSTTHPYIKCIQQKINTIQEQLNTIEQLETTKELTSEEQTEKLVTKARLEELQTTLKELTEPTMTSKYHSFKSITENEIRQKDENQTLSLLHLTYIMRLGQLGLYNVIENAPSLDIMTDLCDQIVGAAVFSTKDPSPQIRSQKKIRVFDLLRKLDQGSEELINESLSSTTSFKQVKDLMSHIWENTTVVKQDQHVNNTDRSYAVLQFENMIPAANTMDKEVDVEKSSSSWTGNGKNSKPSSCDSKVVGTPKDKTWNHVEDIKSAASNNETWDKEAPVQQEDSWKKNEAWDNKDDKQHTQSWNQSEPTTKNGSWDNKDASPVQQEDSWNKENAAPVQQQENSWDKKDDAPVQQQQDWNKSEPSPGNNDKNDNWNKSEPSFTNNDSWKDNKPVEEKSSKSEKSDSWEKVDKFKKKEKNWDNNVDKSGWKSIDNTVKGDRWDNADSPNAPEGNNSQWQSKTIDKSPVLEKDDVSPVVEPTKENTEKANGSSDTKQQSNNYTDNWRSRDENGGRGRGRGRGYTRGRGSRGRGIRARGRGGRGRGGESPEFRHEATTAQQE